MKQALSQAVQRFQRSAFTAGAMARLFIVVGPGSLRLSFYDEMKKADFELIPGKMNPLGLFPMEFLKHQGSHFNRKLFVLDDYDDTVQKLGTEFYRRLEFERKQFTRTATWAIVWIESYELAHELRKKSPGFWNLKHESVLFLDPTLTKDIVPQTSQESVSITSSLGLLPIPNEIQKLSLSTLLHETEKLETRFWGDLLRLSTTDALLSAALILEQKKQCSPELLYITYLLLKEWNQNETAQKLPTLQPKPFQISESPESIEEFYNKCKAERDWVRLGEATLRSIDSIFAEGGEAEAQKRLEDYINSSEGVLTQGAYLLTDRPLRARAMIRRAMGKISQAAQDLEQWENIAHMSALPTLKASALEAKAQHAEEMGDQSQAERLREEAKNQK